MPTTYDVAVIGSGPGGYVAAIKAAQAGLSTVCIEKERLGGVCLNWGCIPTKALLRNAELYEALGEADAYGFSIGKLGYDAGKIVERSRQVADKMNRGVGSLFRKYKVTHVEGAARFTGPLKLAVSAAPGAGKKAGAKSAADKGSADKGGAEKGGAEKGGADRAGQAGSQAAPQEIEAKHVIIATGARPRRIDALPVDHQTVLDYRDALVLKKFPKSLLIVGAGAIGVEFAYYFSAFGVEVHLVEMLPQLLPSEDAEIAEILLKSFRKRGLHCHTGTAVENFRIAGTGGKGKVQATLKGPKESSQLTCDMALIAVGMEAQSDELGLAAAGVKLERGFVQVDAYLRTSAPNVYAIGDVAGHQLLAHKASAEAETAVATIAGHPAHPVDYAQVPACTYCQPQVASIGLTEAACRQQGLKYRVGRFPYAASGKANAIRHLEGMVKLIFGEPYGQLLGAHLIGAEVTELIAELGLAMRLEATYEEILATIHAHPTLSENVFEATGVAYGLSANL